jgi:hypothetical protein
MHHPTNRPTATNARVPLAATLPCAALVAALALGACGQDAAKPRSAAVSAVDGGRAGGGTPAAAAFVLPAGLLSRGPAQGPHVTAAKAAARQGEEIVIVGRIGGSATPFLADRAVFTIVDPALVSCADMSDPDHCRTPWDYCCEDRAKMRAGTATVEVADADGSALRIPLQGAGGLEPLATVAVTGTVTERNDAGLLVIRARKIEVR